MLFRIISTVAMIVGSSWAASPDVPKPPCANPVNRLVLIRLINAGLAQEVRGQAQFVATQILSEAGVHLKWAISPISPRLRRCVSVFIPIELDTVIPSGVHPDVWGYAVPFASSGTKIHIFWERVKSNCDREILGRFLGHVLAHEITHVLQRKLRHSEEGLMKAHWQSSDVYRMGYHSLSLTAQDIDLIHSGLDSFGQQLSPATRALTAGH